MGERGGGRHRVDHRLQRGRGQGGRAGGAEGGAARAARTRHRPHPRGGEAAARGITACNCSNFCQHFYNIEEMEWALELALSYNKPVAATMCIGPRGDEKVEPGTSDH